MMKSGWKGIPDYRQWLIGMIASGDWAAGRELAVSPEGRARILRTRAELYAQAADAIVAVVFPASPSEEP